MTAAVEPQERIEIIDILRGFGLFGVLLVNMGVFKAAEGIPLLMPPPAAPWWDQAAFWLISLFGVAKFYTLLSFLFGLSFYLFMDKAEKKGLIPQVLFKRRIGLLFLFGILHLVFLWSGDILHTYALAGLVLIAFWKTDRQRLKKWVALLLCLTLLLLALMWGIMAGNDQVGRELERQYQQQTLTQSQQEVFKQGSYGEVLAYRVGREVPEKLMNNVLAVPMVLPLMMMGFYSGKSKLFQNLKEQQPLFAKLFTITLLLGILLTALNLTNRLNWWGMSLLARVSINEWLTYLSGVVMSMMYMSGLVLLAQKVNLLPYLKPLAPVGKMALTNYLTHSVVATLLFYGYGLGFFGQTGSFAGLRLTILIFGAQMLFSSYWLKHHTQGPVEGIWRKYTYAKVQKNHVR